MCAISFFPMFTEAAVFKFYISSFSRLCACMSDDVLRGGFVVDAAGLYRACRYFSLCGRDELAFGVCCPFALGAQSVTACLVAVVAC